MKALKHIFLFLFITITSISYACSCNPDTSAIQAFKSSDAVFVGEVVSVHEVNSLEDSLYEKDLMIPYYIYKLSIVVKYKDSYKKLNQSYIYLRTPKHGSACGRNLGINSIYIIYANKWASDYLEVSLCDRSQLYNEQETNELDKLTHF